MSTDVHFRLINSEVKPLTLELAEQFQKLEPSPTERACDAGRIKMLREKAEAGQLITFHWSTARLGGRTLRMNGQHSSAMLTGLDGLFPTGLKVHLDEYEVDNKDALAILFRQFDDRKSGRTASDVAGAYQGLHDQIKDVNRAIAKLAVEGVGWYRREIVGTPVPSGDSLYALFGETGLYSFIRWMGELFSMKTPEMKKKTVVSAIYGTFIANETEAKKFWSEVARGGVEYEESSPQTVLDTWLKSLAERDKDKPDLKPANFYQGCVYAWNAYREDRTIQAIKFDTKKGLHSVSE